MYPKPVGFGRWDSSAGVKLFAMCMSVRGGVGDGACGRVRTRQRAVSMGVSLLILFPEKLVPILCQILKTGPFPLLSLSLSSSFIFSEFWISLTLEQLKKVP